MMSNEGPHGCKETVNGSHHVFSRIHRDERYHVSKVICLLQDN